jgi:hypothetical protein
MLGMQPKQTIQHQEKTNPPFEVGSPNDKKRILQKAPKLFYN